MVSPGQRISWGRPLYQNQPSRLFRLVETNHFSITDQVLEVRQLKRQQIRFAGDLLQQILTWMLSIAGQHLLDIFHDQPFMRDAKEDHAVRRPMKRCNRRVVFIHPLDRSN